MRGPKPIQVHITERQRLLLEQIIGRANSRQHEVTRAKIILSAVEGESNQHIADKLGLHVETARIWRERWVAVWTKLTELEAEVDDKALLSIITNTLAGQPRSGSPGKFSPEQICQIIALACEFPAASGLPISHWTPGGGRSHPTRYC